MSVKGILTSLLVFTLSAQVISGQTRNGKHRPAGPQRNINSVIPPVNYQEFTLPNGLRVILHEDHSTPIVAVNIWYHVGSKNEVPGRTGFAHLFEHMMFQGSKHHDNDYFVPLQEAGGNLNGSTNSDRTNYWEVVPSNFLELALWLESDRMGYLLDVLSEKKLANQRDVVKNEKRQNYDNRPYGLVGAKIAETMYPADHPYHWLTIGSLDDLTAASREDVSDFFRRFYTPNNASLVIAGDINPAQARTLAQKYFGPIKRGPEVVRPNPPQPSLDKEIRLSMEDRVTLPRIYLTWHTVPQFTPNEAALDTLGSILAGGKGSRLYKSLVYEKQIAQDVSAFNNSRELAGQFQITATAKPGITLEQIEKAIADEVARFKAEGPTAEELERAYNAREAAFVYGMQTVGGFGGKSDQLNQYSTFVKKPDYFNEDLARYKKVTADEVKRVATQFLTDRRLVTTVTPAPRNNRRTSGDPAPGGPAAAATSPSEQTAAGSQPAGTSATSAPARPGSTGQRPGTPASASTQTAGAQVQIKAEVGSTTPAGAAPPATAAHQGPGTEKADSKANQGGLYLQPKPGPDPKFNLPTVQRRKLSNGLEVMIVPHTELPVAQFNLVVRTGASADPNGKVGLASLTAALLDEGTRTRSALEVSNQLAAIGASLGTSADVDSSSANLLTLTKHLDRALEIYSDVITNASFPESELKLQRSSRLGALLQRRDSADAIAGVVYSSILYGKNHPYGNPAMGTEASVKAISGDDIRSFYETYYRPNNATLIVVGAVTPDTLVPKLEKAFAAWKPAEVPATEIRSVPDRSSATLYLVDRPGAAQSVISIGQVGVPRSSPDYFPLVVMNTMLGGQFTSRVNMNLREDKGYTYGARTSFDFRRSAGPFSAGAGVQTAVTKESVAEFMKELRGIRGEIPVTQKELEFSKQAIIRGFPRGFETPEQIAGRLSAIALYGLSDDYFNSYIKQIRAVTVADVNRVAQKYLDPSKMAILVVGDRKTIEPGLRSLPEIGSTLTLLDSEGQPVGGNAGNGSGN